MPTSLDEWFVQLGLGVFLGPMPLADLRHLAATGAVLQSDQVRRSGADHWIVAKDVPGLFGLDHDEWISLPDESALPPLDVPDEFAASRASTSPDEEFFETSTDESLTLDPQASPSEPPQTAKTRSPDKLALSPDQPKLKPRPHPMALARPVVREIPPAPLPITHDFEIAFPKVQPTQSTTPTDSKPAIVRADESVSVPPEQRRQMAQPSLTSDVMEAAEPVGTAPQTIKMSSFVRPAPETSPSRPRWPRPSERSWPNGTKPVLLGIAVAGVLLLSWFFWPSSEPNIYAEYRAIYDELRRYRTGAGEVEKWPDFVKQARETTEATNSWLERTAKPGDRDKDLLLYVGRDLQAALELAPDAKFRHQERLDGFMTQLHESFGKP